MDDLGNEATDGQRSALPEYVSHTVAIPSKHVESLAVFQLGAHQYKLATGRWTNTPKADTECQLCCRGGGGSGSVGDEFHIVFACP